LFIETAESFHRNGINLLAKQIIRPYNFLVCTAGWPFLISLAFGLAGQVNVQLAYALSALLSSLSVLLVFYFVSIFFESHQSGLWAAGFFSMVPVFLRLSTSSAMGTSSVFFLFLTLTLMTIYHREEKPALLYLAFLSLSFTVNIRQEAFLVLAPLLLAFFFLFHKNPRREFGKPHIYIALILFVLFYIPAATVSIFGITTGYYYFYESSIHIRNHIISNLQSNVIFWVSNRIQPLFMTILALLGGWALWHKDRRAAWFMLGWFLFMQIFYSINPSCEFSSMRTLDSWRNSSHQNSALIILAGLAATYLVDYFRKNRPRAVPLVTGFLILALIFVPVRFHSFITFKSIWAREYVFLREQSRRMDPEALVVSDRGVRRPWPHFFSHLQYAMAVPLKGYLDFDPEKPYSARPMIRDMHRWIYRERRPVYLHMSAVNDKNFGDRFQWYEDHLILEPVDGYSDGYALMGFMLYRVKGIKQWNIQDGFIF